MISQNEIRRRAATFAHEFATDTDEKGEAAPFWEQFFAVFGVSRRRVASFEYRVKKADGAQGFIDVFWPGVLLAEHKTTGRDLDKAYQQALEYLDGLKEGELPRYIIVSDFARMRVYDLEVGDEFEFPLADLPQQIERFGFISGYEVQKYEAEEQASIKAAELMAKFHNAIADTGYTGHALEVFLTRTLFCLFSEDTGIFERRQFQHYIEQRTNEDGSDLGVKILELFYVLNTPQKERQSNQDEQLAAFPYVNGQIFAERLDPISLDAKARETLLTCCAFDWSQISASIFGSLFQGVMDEDERRQLGAHYTSELNIMKVIEPLFLDELYTEFDTAKRSTKRLEAFHQKLASLTFLDPACGCGNFLVTTYRELRKLELEVLKKKRKEGAVTLAAFGAEDLARLHVNQFYGIEIEEFPALVARTAMYLADHQATMQMEREFGLAIPRIPLEEPATIVNANALTLDWAEVVPPSDLNYILGNPPFYGAMEMTTQQRADLVEVFGANFKGAGVLDFVSAWYKKSADYIDGTSTKVGLVSTNSITQGEQVTLLWDYLIKERGLHINFAHQTFKWKNEAKGNAAVYCVIIGFANEAVDKKYLYSYQDITGEPYEQQVQHINAYLLAAPDIFVKNISKPICNVPEMIFGNMPRDGGNLLLTDEEKEALLESEPTGEAFIKPYISAKEFLNNKKRWCLWLVNASPAELRKLPNIMHRIEKVRQMRLASKASSTNKMAQTPTLFGQLVQPDSDYILIPRHSSERREYIPMGFFSANQIVADSCLAIPNATLYHFGVLTSKMHMAWVRYTCGRLESRYRYSKDIVYNNFPWPGCAESERDEGNAESDGNDLVVSDQREHKNGRAPVVRSEPSGVSSETKAKIEAAAQGVLDARAAFPESSLADLYDPRTMPPALQKAHTTLDRAVDQAYGIKPHTTDPDRIAFLFALYKKVTQK